MNELDSLAPFFINIIGLSLVLRFYFKVKEKKMYIGIIAGSFIGMILMSIYKSIT